MAEPYPQTQFKFLVPAGEPKVCLEEEGPLPCGLRVELPMGGSVPANRMEEDKENLHSDLGLLAGGGAGGGAYNYGDEGGCYDPMEEGDDNGEEEEEDETDEKVGTVGDNNNQSTSKTFQFLLFDVGNGTIHGK